MRTNAEYEYEYDIPMDPLMIISNEGFTGPTPTRMCIDCTMARVGDWQVIEQCRAER